MPDTPDTEGDLSARQIAFLRDVLGVQIAPATAPPPLLEVWMRARERTGEQINDLQNVLKSSGLPLFERIADKGLNGITSGQLTTMQGALSEFDAAKGDAGAMGKVQNAIVEMRAFLEKNQVLPILERNPFGIEISVRATLEQALGEIEKHLTPSSGA